MPKSKLISRLGELHPVSKPYQKFIEENDPFIRKSVKKNTPLNIHGKNANELHFVNQGKFKMYQVDENNDEQPVDFFMDGTFILVPEKSADDAQNQLPLFIVALENSEVLSISLDALDRLGNQFSEVKIHVSRIGSRIAARRLKHISILFKPPIDRYALFFKEFKSVCGKISSTETWGFLGICPKTLQRSKILFRMKARGKK